MPPASAEYSRGPMARTDTSATTRSRGAYGLRIVGLRKAARLLLPAGSAWPRLRVVVEQGHAAECEGMVDDERAVVLFQNGGMLEVDRRSARAVYTLPQDPTPDELVHPYLAPAAAAMARWHGRETFHAGAFVVGSGVWGVLAEREGGKSSTLASMALDGVAIVCDDVLVLEANVAYAGPRAIDLRGQAARALGVGEPLGVVGSRERWRLALDDVEIELPLRGWVFLTWGDALAFESVPAGERLRRLAGQRAVALPPTDPGVLLRLAALPGFELRRPRRWSSIAPAVELLLTSLP